MMWGIDDDVSIDFPFPRRGEAESLVWMMMMMMSLLTWSWCSLPCLMPPLEVAATFRARHAVVFSCSRCALPIFRALSSLGIPASVVDPNREENTSSTAETLPNWMSTLLVGDLGCEGTALLMQNLPAELFSPPYRWLVFASPPTLADSLPFRRFRLDSDLVLCVRDDSRGFKFPRLGRGNAEGGTIRAIVARMSLSYKSASLFERTGFGPHDINARLFLHIGDLFNFSIQERIIQGVSSDAEIFRALKEGTSDVAVIVMGMIPQRSGDVAYLHPVSRLRATVTFLQPQASGLQNVFTLPFSEDVWMSLAILVILVFAFLTFDACVVLGDASDVFLITVALVCQKGIAKFPRVHSARIVAFSFSVATALLHSAYSGQIVSLSSTRDPPIKSVKDLSDRRFQLGVDAYPYLNMYFADSTDASVQQLGRDRRTVLFPNAAEFIRKPRTCYSTSDYQADILKSAFRDEELCKLTVFNVPRAEVPLAMAVAKRSRYKETLNRGTLVLMERGLYSRYKNETEKRITSQCSEARHSVELLGLLSAFYVLVGGTVSAAVLLLLEVVIWKLG